MKKWNLLSSAKIKTKENLLNILLENRNIKTKKEKKAFLNPDLSRITVQSVEINTSQLQKSVKRIYQAIKNQEQMIMMSMGFAAQEFYGRLSII